MICKKIYNIYDPNWEKNIIVKFPAFFLLFFFLSYWRAKPPELKLYKNAN